MEVFINFYEQYNSFLLLGFIAFIISLIATPLTGVWANRLNILDLPANLRSQADTTKSRRLHDLPMPTLGGVAVFIGFIVATVYGYNNSNFDIDHQRFIFIALGAISIFLLGYVDTRVDLSSKNQFLVEVAIAIIVSIAGIRIDFIEILGQVIRFDFLQFTFEISGYTLAFTPLADLITVVWIVGVINAINWVSGIDGLGASISAFAAITFMFIGVKYEVFLAALLSASLAGAILGFLPYNFPPAKTFNGSTGDMLQGFLLAVLAIISGAKLTASIILLAIPLIDAAWVLLWRLVKHHKEIRTPFQLMKISDKTHLHHRFLSLGLSVRQTLFIEVFIFLVFCIAAYHLAGFSDETITMMAAIIVTLALFIMIMFINVLRAGKKVISGKDTSEHKANQVVETEAPEDRFAY